MPVTMQQKDNFNINKETSNPEPEIAVDDQ